MSVTLLICLASSDTNEIRNQEAIQLCNICCTCSEFKVAQSFFNGFRKYSVHASSCIHPCNHCVEVDSRDHPFARLLWVIQHLSCPQVDIILEPLLLLDDFSSQFKHLLYDLKSKTESFVHRIAFRNLAPESVTLSQLKAPLVVSQVSQDFYACRLMNHFEHDWVLQPLQLIPCAIVYQRCFQDFLLNWSFFKLLLLYFILVFTRSSRR